MPKTSLGKAFSAVLESASKSRSKKPPKRNPPEPPRKSPKSVRDGMTLRQILKNTLKAPDRRNSQYVGVLRITKGKADGPVSLKSQTITNDLKNKQRRKHVQRIWAKDPDYRGTIGNCRSIMVDCDCLRYLYTWEYSLWKRGAARIQRSNGEPPVITNPTERAAPCKHLMRVFEFILREGY